MLRRLVDIRSGEAARLLLAFVILMLVVGSYTVVKAVRDAVFLSKFGVTQLSFIAIGLAFLTSFIVSIYLRATGGVPRNILIGGTNVVVAGSLAGIWMLLGADEPATWVPWVLYIWSSVFGVFTVMQFWLLANDLFDAREAKRLFGFVGAGAILGGITGGFASRGLAQLISTRGLLLVAGGMLLLAAVLANVVYPLRRQETAPKRKARQSKKKVPEKRGFAVVSQNPYVRLIALALLFSTLATTLLDWQFKAITKAHFAGRTDEMAAFFGSLFGYLSVASFALQTLVTGWVLRRFGVGVGLMMLPVSLMFGSLGILLYPLLPFGKLHAASGAKVAEGGLRFAIDKASMELMWLPVPPKTKEQGKAFVDTVVDRFGTGLTGLIWLGLAAAGFTGPDRIHLVSAVVLVLVGAWITVLLRARAAYIDAFRETLASRSLDLEQLTLGLMDAKAKEIVESALRSDDAREVGFGLYLVSGMGGDVPDLSNALRHSDDRVRCEALKLLSERRDRGHRKIATECLRSDALEVREAAVAYLHRTAPGGADPVIEGVATDDERAAFAVAVIRLGAPESAMAAAETIRKRIAAADGEQRPELVRLLGGAPPEMAAALLAPLLKDAASDVVDAAMRAAGRSGAASLVPTLTEMLADRRCRPRAAAALREMAEAATAHLSAALKGGHLPLDAQVSIVRLLGASGRAEMAPELIALLEHAEQRLSLAALRALVRLRGQVELEVDTADVHRLIDQASERAYRDMLLLGQGSWPTLRAADVPGQLFERALRERIDGGVSRLFSLLGLLHEPADVRAAYDGTRSPLKAIRASSIEFLDNLLDKRVKARILPLLEDSDAGQLAVAAKRAANVQAEQRDEGLRRLLGDGGPWVEAVACWTIGREGRKELRDALEQRVGQGPAEIGAVAKRSLHWLDGGEMEEPKMALTVIEKALKLQTVDVLERCSSEDLAQVAQIAQEQVLEADTPIYAEGDAPEALFVVISGTVKLQRGKEEIGSVKAGEAFGSWALFDEAPRVASASTTEPTTLLKVDREEFLELLADRVDIVQAVFRAMVARLRQLADVVKSVP